jgi:hypothetical protein
MTKKINWKEAWYNFYIIYGGLFLFTFMMYVPAFVEQPGRVLLANFCSTTIISFIMWGAFLVAVRWRD